MFKNGMDLSRKCLNLVTHWNKSYNRTGLPALFFVTFFLLFLYPKLKLRTCRAFLMQLTLVPKSPVPCTGIFRDFFNLKTSDPRALPRLTTTHSCHGLPLLLIQVVHQDPLLQLQPCKCPSLPCFPLPLSYVLGKPSPLWQPRGSCSRLLLTAQHRYTRASGRLDFTYIFGLKSQMTQSSDDPPPWGTLTLPLSNISFDACSSFLS